MQIAILFATKNCQFVDKMPIFLYNVCNNKLATNANLRLRTKKVKHVTKKCT